jgi:hypothetical protein
LLDAVEALGIADSTELDVLRREAVCVRAARRRAHRGARLRRGQRAARAHPVARHVALRPRQRRARRDSGLAIFGLDLFQNASSTLFDPNLAGPVDQSYQLGPGDRLVLVLTGDVESAYNLLVTREGFIVVPRPARSSSTA